MSTSKLKIPVRANGHSQISAVTDLAKDLRRFVRLVCHLCKVGSLSSVYLKLMISIETMFHRVAPTCMSDPLPALAALAQGNFIPHAAKPTSEASTELSESDDEITKLQATCKRKETSMKHV